MFSFGIVAENFEVFENDIFVHTRGELYADSKARPEHGKLRALLFSNSAWVFLRPAELSTMKSCETGLTVLSSLAETTRKSNHLQM